MPKSKSIPLVKLKPLRAELRALIAKRNQERFDQLVTATKANGDMASRLARLIGLDPGNLAADLLRDFKTAADRVHGKSPAKAARKGRR
jgi:ATP phosphoribosyltransferase regulatory subunit HisZ